MRFILPLAVALTGAGCAPSMPAGPGRAPGLHVTDEPDEPRFGPAAPAYLTDAQPNGIVGGRAAEQLATEVAQALRERGAEAQPDGALAATAAWFLRESSEGRVRGSGDAERVARRHGFAGGLLSAVTCATEGPDSVHWRKSLAELPVNVPVTRFGVRASPAGVAAIAFGTVEAELRPIPRRLAPGQTVRLRGEIGKRFERAIVYLTGVDGKVKETRMPGRRVDASLEFPVPGVYQAEVMGDGASGPAVLVNVPIHVGVAEPEIGSGQLAGARPAAAAINAAQAEARMLVLLNGDRARAGLPPLVPDAELRAVALGHSEDMARARFVGHVSPTTGTPEDRIKKAGLWLAGGGENVSKATSADAAHEDLMNSPGHRANMISARFTHVGIAVVPDGAHILATLVFGRRRAPDALFTRQQALEAIATLRKSRGLPPAQDDAVLRAAAAAGIQAFASGGSDAAFRETNAAIAREAGRRAESRAAGCVRIFEIGDVDQIGDLPAVLDPKLRRIGVGATKRIDGNATLLVLLLVSEGTSCQ